MPRKKIEEVLKLAQRAPSGTNTQPWYVHVCTGKICKMISKEVLELMQNGAGYPYEDFDYYQKNGMKFTRLEEEG